MKLWALALLFVAGDLHAAVGDVCVKFRKGQAYMLAAATKVDHLPLIDVEVWRPASGDQLGFVAQLEGDPAIEWVEPDYPAFPVAIPNDPRFGEQWALHNTGQSGGVVDADVDAPEGWDVSTGSEFVVNVNDTGISLEHPDLIDRLWVNFDEIPGNGIDDDGNGKIDDIHGWDFWYNNPDLADTHSHGTHCSGIVGATQNNGVGISGVAPNVKIMMTQGFQALGAGTLSTLCNGILYAAANGAKVSSNSWVATGKIPNNTMTATLDVARTAGMLVVFAAANDATNVDCIAECPGASGPLTIINPHDNLLVVASTDRLDALSSFSNYGVTVVDMGAPGSNILSTIPTPFGAPDYGLKSGTSMACPLVAGAAALYWSQNPTATYLEVKQALMSSGDPIPALIGKTVSGKRLNIANLMSGTVAVQPAAMPRPRRVWDKYIDVSGRRADPTRSGRYFGRDTLVVK